jgi:FKBP-type peptidyl-prolyl cis-trans isomerase 2
LEPGARVRLKGAPDWGIGQIQSVAGHKVTVNFEHAGKQVINTSLAELVPVDDTDERPCR